MLLYRLLLIAASIGVGVCAAQASKDPAARPVAPFETHVFQADGDPARPASLRVTLLTPQGPGPFPLVVWNHGSTGDPSQQDMSDYTNHFGTYYFLSRGYAVALPLMRGFGGSEGRLSVSGCRFDALAADDARDIVAVLNRIAREPGIDARRIIVAGGSFGGWNALAVGSRNDPRVRGVVNFYGGLHTTSCQTPDEALRKGAAAFGARSRTPSIWFYGDNDHLFPRATWEAMHRAYQASGGQAELVRFGTFLFDSHKLLSFPEGLPIFAPRLDAFLTRLGLSAAITHPEYLPLTSPPATGYARIDDVAAVPYLNEPARAIYRKFLARPFPRAFVIAPGKLAIDKSGGFDPLERCMAECREHDVECRPYAVDDKVVWNPSQSTK